MLPLKKRVKPHVDITACKLILRNLMSERYKSLAWVFYDPIDSQMLALYDYHVVVKEPMDLSKVKSRLDSNYYMTAADFARDVRLIFSNTYLYTTPGHLCYEMAKELEAIFEDMYAKVPLFNNGNESGIWSDTSSDINVCDSIGSQTPSNMSYTTDSVIGREVEAQSPMISKEDLELHNRVQKLDGVMLLNVIHMVHAMEDVNFGHAVGELVFDVRHLKANTKRAILSYLDSGDMTNGRLSGGKKIN